MAGTKPSLTPRARKAIKRAFKITESLLEKEVKIEHLFLSLLHLRSGPILEMLDFYGIDKSDLVEVIENELANAVKKIDGEEYSVEGFSKEVDFVMQFAYTYAKELDHEYTGPEHLFIGILNSPKSSVAELFVELGLSIEEVKEKIEDCFSFNLSPKKQEEIESQPSTTHKSQPNQKALETYATNYNILAMNKSFNNLSSRDEELKLLSRA